MTLDPDAEDSAIDFEAALRNARIVVLFLALAVLAYIVFAIIVTSVDVEAPLSGDEGTMWILRVAFGVASIFNVLLARFLGTAIAEGRRSMLSEGVDMPPLPNRLQTATILAAAVAEVIGLYGLLLTIIGGNLLDSVVFGAIGLGALASFFPRRDAWEAEARREAMLGAA